MVIGKLASIAQHRMETHKDHEWYEQATDVRTQLKFFEHLERLEKQRKDDQEREILLKAAKSRSRQEDPEQARLKQKAKEKIPVVYAAAQEKRTQTGNLMV
ncbi:hypothetical protein scyTo_0014101 [Scyliorhinus torazame]|uniref:Transcription initiation factor TFIID component TAF4 C-terminal domain-containing protein n=1 Tax=Scyliorhinus torazame TaxID=75743 RepID=A0A401NGL1_SCYTO|nr:hypothetical protein [Scyliorhinus torazame]